MQGQSAAEWDFFAGECAKFAATLHDTYPRGVFTLDFLPRGHGRCIVAVYDTIPYPSDLAGSHPGKDGEEKRVIERLTRHGAKLAGGAMYPDPGDRPDRVAYALLFEVSISDKEMITQAFLKEVDRGIIE